jgi:hypothetical protein
MLKETMIYHPRLELRREGSGSAADPLESLVSLILSGPNKAQGRVQDATSAMKKTDWQN